MAELTEGEKPQFKTPMPQTPATKISGSRHLRPLRAAAGARQRSVLPYHLARCGALDTLRPTESPLLVGSPHNQPMEATNG